MKKRTRILAWVTVVLTGVWLCSLLFFRGPGYQGRSIDYWFEEGQRVRGPDVDAFRAMGLAAVPYLVEQVNREDSRWVRFYGDNWQKLPDWLKRRVSPPPFPNARREHALTMLTLMGAPAQAGVPGLIATYNRLYRKIHHLPPDFPVDWVAEFMHPALVSAGDTAVPGSSTNQFGIAVTPRPWGMPELRFCRSVIATLSSLGGDNSQVIPLLMASLRDQTLGAELVAFSGEAESFAGFAPASKGCEPMLIAALEDANLDIRTAAAKLLGPLTPDHPSAVPPLLKALQDYRPPPPGTYPGAGPSVRVRPFSFNGWLSQPGSRLGPGYLPEVVMASLAEAGSEQEKIAGLFRGLLSSSHPMYLRPQAIRCLARLGGRNADARRVILQALESTNREEWVGAARALGQIGLEVRAALPALPAPTRETLEPDLQARYRLAEAFGTFHRRKDDMMSRLVEELLLSEDSEAHSRIIAPLIESDARTTPGVPWLIQVLKCPNPGLRLQAVYALGQIGPAAREAAPALKQVMGDEPAGMREAVEIALKRIVPELKAP